MSNLNLAANLQYNGQRWYDAGAGLNIQPGSFGGAPVGLQYLYQFQSSRSFSMSAPQSSYTTKSTSCLGLSHTGCSALGVGIAASTGLNVARIRGLLNTTLAVPYSELYPHTFLNIEASISRLNTKRTLIQSALKNIDGELLGSFSGIRETKSGTIRQIARDLYGFNRYVDEAEISELLIKSGYLSGQGFFRAEFEFNYILARSNPRGVSRLGRALGPISDLRFAAYGFGVDFVLGAGFQAWEDSYNPNLTANQRVWRPIVGGVGGGFFSLIGSETAIGLCSGLAITNPYGLAACGIAGAATGAYLWAAKLQSSVYESLYLNEQSR